jgi:putative ABC transport system substrate-binding protein
LWRTRSRATVDENDPADEGQSGLAAFREELGKVGWTDGRNIEIHARWGAADIESMKRFAKELVGLQPDLPARSAHTRSADATVRNLTVNRIA